VVRAEFFLAGGSKEEVRFSANLDER
jgi:hypothetical protein